MRLPFSLLQTILILGRKSRNRHPVQWDELVVLPLPNTLKFLSYKLQQDELPGLRLLADVARNPFQRPYVQQALQAYLHRHRLPLHLLYKRLDFEELNEYVFAPVEEKDWKLIPATKKLLLGELAGRRVNCYLQFEILVWWLTRFLRDKRQTPLTGFAGLLYRLLDEEIVESEDFDLSEAHKVCANLTDYPGGVEIAGSFAAMSSFLSYQNLFDLATVAEVIKPIEKIALETAIRPSVLKALSRLGKIGAEVAAYRDATSLLNKQAALLRASDALEKLNEYVIAEVLSPEKEILQRIVRQWRKFTSEESGDVGNAAMLAPVENPYIAGNPVTGDLFVGRDDIMLQLEELWAKSGQCLSVILYGHRRMGKSSILQNLGARFGSQKIIVDFNMQVVVFVQNTGELLYSLALALYDRLPPSSQEKLAEPAEESFSASNPYHAFNRFCQKLGSILAGTRFIVAIDEFELIEEKIKQNRLDRDLLEFFRGLIHTYPWLILAFAGLHNLEEMRRDYWNPLFASVTAIPVSFLSAKAARRLIVQPSPDFALDYDEEAIDRIINLSNGQPYLVQLICHALVARFNRQAFEEGRERERRFSLQDVEAIINSEEFYRDGDAYFNGVWAQAEEKPQGQLEILEKLSREPMSEEELAQATGLDAEQIALALEVLENHDVILKRGERYFYTVKLMERWVARVCGV